MCRAVIPAESDQESQAHQSVIELEEFHYRFLRRVLKIPDIRQIRLKVLLKVRLLPVLHQ